MRYYHMRLMIWLSLVVVVSGVLVAPRVYSAPQQRNAAVPGDNYAYDDPLSSARMAWWRDAKFALFIHWGLYAQLAGEWNGCRAGEWIMYTCNIPIPTYESYAPQFNPTQFNATQWVRL